MPIKNIKSRTSERQDVLQVFALYDAIPDLPYFRESYKHEEDAHHSSQLGYIPSVWFMHRCVTATQLASL